MKERIKAIRLALELTQDEFADGLDCSRGVVSNIEYGYVQPKEKIINRICKTYNVNKEYILEGRGEMFRKDPLGDRIGEIAAAAAKNSPEAAASFFRRFYEDFGEEELLLMYEIFKRRFPQYDTPDKEQKNED